MKKLLVTILAFTTLGAASAADIEASLVCVDGRGVNLANIDIAAEKVGETYIATLGKSLAGVKVSIPESPLTRRYANTASAGNIVLDGFSLNDPNRSDYMLNKRLDSNNSLLFGYYKIDAGYYSLVSEPATLNLEVLKETALDYDESRGARDVAIATVTFAGGDSYKAFCDFDFYGE